MGADLYIESITNKAKEEHQPKFDELVAARSALGKVDPDTNDPNYEALTKRIEEEYEAMYPDDGYFRDSYNGSAILWRLFPVVDGVTGQHVRDDHLSWWDDVAHMCDDGFLKGDQLLEFRKLVQEAEIRLPTAAELKEAGCAVDEDKNSAEVWASHFVDKRDRLIRFLDKAIELGEPIYCSL